MKRTGICSVILSMILTVACVSAGAEPSDSERAEGSRRKMAVTLNYCRAALHRIRRAPSKSILLEEQQRILNNLDLNQIEDPEVITLYRSILDEIGQVEISDRERVVIQEHFRRGVQRKMGTDVFVIGAQTVTGQVGSAMQTGASSWWDYRNTQIKRDTDLWQLEKTQFSTLITRSSTFLDSFWRLSRKNEIPDRWLLRDQDLDQLSEVLAESDAERRLRMLGRMEKFMECYPPYWYYIARTEQQLGRLDAAAATFQRLAELGRGHFRQDDMLASSLANLSLIQETKGESGAVATALTAADYSSRNWEANLVCAWVLGRHQKYDSAEDLILCNLDEQLEADQSTVALVSLYYHADNRTGLVRLLEDEENLSRIPVPGLLLCARLLGSEHLPKAAETFLSSTLQATRRRSGRMNSIAVAAAAGWKLSDADVRISDGRQVFRSAGHRSTVAGVEVNFVTSLDAPMDVSGDEALRMTLKYPGSPTIEILMKLEDEDQDMESGRSAAAHRLPLLRHSFTGAMTGQRVARSYRIHEIKLDGVKVSCGGWSDELLPEAEEEHKVLKPEFSGDNPASRS